MESRVKAALNGQQITARTVVALSFAIMMVDTIYMNLNGIFGANHNKCIVFNSMPKWMFYLLENVGELILVVIIGVMISVVAEQYFRKIKRFYPSTQLLAFAYGAILPVCSCGAVPLIDSMKRRTPLRVIVTFICAAPLLDPYIIFLSYTVLGLKYLLLRIIASFLLAYVAGWCVELIAKRAGITDWDSNGVCGKQCNFVAERDPFVKTLKITKKLIPYILIGGLLSFAFAMADVKELLHSFNLNQEPYASILMTIFGIPIYMCHGADVIFLKPFLQYTDLSLGSAMAFSLSSSALCVSSIVMLAKYLGKKIAIILTLTISVLIVLLSIGINMIV